MNKINTVLSVLDVPPPSAGFIPGSASSLLMICLLPRQCKTNLTLLSHLLGPSVKRKKETTGLMWTQSLWHLLWHLFLTLNLDWLLPNG
jgi:hypothetical protein